jgi:hypothetical protein
MIKLIGTKKWTVIALVIILIIALSIRLIFFQGVGTSDSRWHADWAYDISNGKFPSGPNQGNARIGLLIPVSLLYSIFGVNEFSSNIIPLMTSLLGIILIFLFGRLLFNEKVGLIAAFLLSFFPLDVLYATRLMSDLPSAIFSVLSVYLFLKAEKTERSTKTSILYVLSGISLAIAFSIREMAILTLLFYLGYVIYNKKIKLSYGLMAAGFLSIFILELYFFYAHTGNPFYRFDALSGNYIQDATILNFFGRLSFPEFFLAYPFVIFNNIQLGYFYTFISLAILYFIFNRNRGTTILIIWIGMIYLYLNFGSSSLSSYAPFLAVARYLNYITIPGILLLAAFLMENEKIIRKIILPFTLVFLLFISLGAIHLDEYRYSLDNLRETYSYINSVDKPIYTDFRSIIVIDYISGYDHNLNLIDLVSINVININDSYVIINNQMIKNLKAADRGMFLQEIKQVPSTWVKIKEIGKGPDDNVLIYNVE